MDTAAFTDLVLKAGAGALLATLANWGIGRLNNAMTISLSSKRYASERGEDIVALTVTFKKAPPTRVRLDACEATVTIDGAPCVDLANALTRSFGCDILVAQDRGMTLVSGDEVRYEAPCRVPARATLHVCVKLKTTQLVCNAIETATPFWTSSIVVLPLRDDLTASPLSARGGEG